MAPKAPGVVNRRAPAVAGAAPLALPWGLSLSARAIGPVPAKLAARPAQPPPHRPRYRSRLARYASRGAEGAGVVGWPGGGPPRDQREFIPPQRVRPGAALPSACRGLHITGQTRPTSACPAWGCARLPSSRPVARLQLGRASGGQAWALPWWSPAMNWPASHFTHKSLK
jgi:hypothetical protein